MLYVIQNGYNMVAPTVAEDIVYCVTSVQTILDFHLDFIFTNGHASSKFSTQHTAKDIHNINNILDFEAINAKYWKDENDLDKKRRKEAELLVLSDIPCQAILAYITYNEKAKNSIIDFGADINLVHIKSEYYF